MLSEWADGDEYIVKPNKYTEQSWCLFDDLASSFIIAMETTTRLGVYR